MVHVNCLAGDRRKRGISRKRRKVAYGRRLTQMRPVPRQAAGRGAELLAEVRQSTSSRPHKQMTDDASTEGLAAVGFVSVLTAPGSASVSGPDGLSHSPALRPLSPPRLSPLLRAFRAVGRLGVLFRARGGGTALPVFLSGSLLVTGGKRLLSRCVRTLFHGKKWLFPASRLLPCAFRRHFPLCTSTDLSA